MIRQAPLRHQQQVAQRQLAVTVVGAGRSPAVSPNIAVVAPDMVTMPVNKWRVPAMLVSWTECGT